MLLMHLHHEHLRLVLGIGRLRGRSKDLGGLREPPPRRREVSRTRLVTVGLAVVVGGSRQILPTATISFFN